MYHSRGRLLPFLPDLLRARDTSARRLAQLRRQRRDYLEIHLGQALWTRLPCGRRFHHPKWLGPDAIDSEPDGEGAGVMDGMVSRSVPAPLSDVLGRAFGLPHLAFRRAFGENRQPHRAEPARSAIREHQRELLLSKRSLVVFFHAHPVLSNLSAAFLDSEKTRAMEFFANRVCRRIFRGLSDAGRLCAKRLVD